MLRLKFDPMYFQLMLDALQTGFCRWRAGGVALLHPHLRFLAQGGRISWQVGSHITARILRQLWSWRPSCHKTLRMELTLDLPGSACNH